MLAQTHRCKMYRTHSARMERGTQLYYTQIHTRAQRHVHTRLGDHTLLALLSCLVQASKKQKTKQHLSMCRDLK